MSCLLFFRDTDDKTEDLTDLLNRFPESMNEPGGYEWLRGDGAHEVLSLMTVVILHRGIYGDSMRITGGTKINK